MNEWLDSRRLIGPNLVWDRPGALLEVAGDGEGFQQRLTAWRRHVRVLMDALHWQGEDLAVRPHPGGALLVISAPVDVLYTATEVNETAWRLACGAEDLDTESELEWLLAQRNQEADPSAVAMHAAAEERGKTCLVDEDGTSVGMGCCSRMWPPREAPIPEYLDWSSIEDIPTALVTGTNGKTTTVRLLAAMVKAAGLTPGLSSTNGIQVGDQTLDEGDYSGPGGARQVLRDRRTQIAILETARGGLLRRGLAVDRARVAVVTNIAEDHLGDGGILTIEDLAELKFMVTRVLGDSGVAVLNADDAYCRAHGEGLPGPVAWFSLDGPPDRRARDAVYWLDGDVLRRSIKGQVEALVRVDQSPFMLGGGARHNIANALAASAAAEALGLTLDAIRQTLSRFGAKPGDNPGRAEVLELGGVRVLLDFAHNPEGMHAIFSAGRSLGANRIGVVFGQAGDRSDAAIVDLTRSVVEAGVDHFVVKEMAEYRRGREPGEVPWLIIDTLRASGVESGRIQRVGDEVEAALAAYRWARPGDLIMLFVHSERDAVLAALRKEAEG